MSHLKTVIKLLAVIALSTGVLAACRQQHEKGDPVKISRDFIVATWTGSAQQAKKLSCPGVEWSITGDPTLTVDAEHLTFEIVSQTENQIDVEMSGVVTFKSASGQTEVRNLDDLGHTHFILEDHKGWKVCDVR
jgi:hypothetical protein